MAVAEHTSLEAYCLDVAQRAQRAQAALATVPRRGEKCLAHGCRPTAARAPDRARSGQRPRRGQGRRSWADARRDRSLAADAQDDRVDGPALEDVAAMPEPIGEVIESSQRPNGLEVLKVRVPLGVIFFIYESRPNVTSDAAAVAIKSGNAVILRGGKEAVESNRAIAALLSVAARETGIPEDAVQLVDTTDRAAVGHFLRLDKYISVAIPRRRGADPPRGRRGRDAGHQALYRQLPHLRRSLGRSGHGRADHAQRQVPADGRLQRRRVVGGAQRRLRPVLAAAFAAARRAGRGNPRRRPRCRHYVATGAGQRSRLLCRVSRADDFGQGGRFVGRGHRAHQPLWFAAHRCDRDFAIWRRPGISRSRSTARQ